MNEEVLGRTVEGKDEVLTIRKFCTGNPAETFETIITRRIPLPQPKPKVKSKSTVKAKVKQKQEIFRDELMRAPKIKK